MKRDREDFDQEEGGEFVKEEKSGISDWKIKTYKLYPIKCTGCGVHKQSYFTLTYRNADGILYWILRCDGCTFSIPSLLMESNRIRNLYSRTFTITGNFYKREHDMNKFIVSKRSKEKVSINPNRLPKQNDNLIFYSLLEEIKNAGLKVPIFGQKWDYIAITGPAGNYISSKTYTLKVKLEYWRHSSVMAEGYNIVLA